MSKQAPFIESVASKYFLPGVRPIQCLLGDRHHGVAFFGEDPQESIDNLLMHVEAMTALGMQVSCLLEGGFAVGPGIPHIEKPPTTFAVNTRAVTLWFDTYDKDAVEVWRRFSQEIRRFLKELKLAKGRRIDQRTVYCVRNGQTGLLKIGFASNLKTRIRCLETQGGTSLELIWQMPGGARTESALHKRFANHRVLGEWFRDVPDIRLAEAPKLEPVN